MGHGVHGARRPASAATYTHVTPIRATTSTSTTSAPKDDSDPIYFVSWQQARAAVASLDSNPTMGAIRATITSTGLPVSPGTGGLARRTKVHIVAELRSMVGLSPLSAPVEMGIAVEATPPPPPELAPSPAQIDSPAVPAPAAPLLPLV